MLKLSKDAPMADLLNRGMVAVLILCSIALLTYLIASNVAGLMFGSDADVIKLAATDQSDKAASSLLFLLNILFILPVYLPRWGRLMQSVLGGVLLLIFSLTCLRLYLATGQSSSIPDGDWFAVWLLVILMCVNAISYFRKPYQLKDKAPQLSSTWQRIFTGLVLLGLGVAWVWGLVSDGCNIKTFGIYGVAFAFLFLLPQFDKRPGLRIAALTLALAIVIILMVLFIMDHGIDMIVRHWDVALVVGYLPLMLLGWFGYTRFKAGKQRYDN